MLQAALLDMDATTIIELKDAKMGALINRILHTSDNSRSCFYDEIRITRRRPPTLRSLIASKAKVYALVGGLRVYGCVALDGDYLFSLCVDPDARGQGLGTRLLQHVLSEHPNRRICLSVFQPDSDAGRTLVAYYARHGFKPERYEGQYLRMRR